MTRPYARMSHVAGILVLSSVVVANASCRVRPPSSAKTKNAAINPLAEFEVVDCTPKLCGDDVSVVNINPEESDMVALGASSDLGQFALDESVAVEDVGGKDAEKAIDKSTAASSFMRSAIGGSSKKDAQITGTSLTGLFGGLSGVLTGVSAMNKFARENIDAASDADRAKTLTRVTSLLSQTAKLVKEEDKEKLIAAMPTLKALAGEDGWINRGDLPRFLPVIPNIVGRVADEKISQGYAEGIADLARSRPFAYRRWVRAPGGMIGRIVNRGIDAELNKAYSQKWGAIRQASDAFQGAYNSLMDQFGTTSYYLNVDDGKNYYDPGTPVQEDQINRLAEIFAGQSLDSIVRAAADNPQNVQLPSVNLGASEILLESVVLPDGVPIADIEQLLRDTASFTKAATPEGLSFKLLPNDKLQITKLRKSGSDTSTNSNTTSKAETTASSSVTSTTVKCQGTTVLDRNRNVMLYLYSSTAGTNIELRTVNGYFDMGWVMDPQQNWPLIRGGYAHSSWRTLDSVPMRITLQNGNTVECSGPISHR